jgi:hypothetical protein
VLPERSIVTNKDAGQCERAMPFGRVGPRIFDDRLHQRRLGVGVVTVANQQSYPGYLTIRAIDLVRSYGAVSCRYSPVKFRIPAKAQGARGDQYENSDCQNTNGSFSLQPEHGILLWCGTNQSLARAIFLQSQTHLAACVGLRASSMSRRPSSSGNPWLSAATLFRIEGVAATVDFGPELAFMSRASAE